MHRVLLIIGVVAHMCTSLPLEGSNYKTGPSNSYFKNDGSGDYSYRYQTADGLYREETGMLVTINDKKYVVVAGKYTTLTDDGKVVEVSYLADTNGYKITNMMQDVALTMSRAQMIEDMAIRTLCVIIFIISMKECAPLSESERPDAIIVYENRNDGLGNYRFRFETAKGITRDETGTLVTEGDRSFVTVRGKYSYINPEGKTIKVSYYGDQNGYHIAVNPDE